MENADMAELAEGLTGLGRQLMLIGDALDVMAAEAPRQGSRDWTDRSLMEREFKRRELTGLIASIEGPDPRPVEKPRNPPRAGRS
jgi:hypothetical protein